MCDSCRDFFVFFSFKLFSFDASFSFNLLMITGTPNVSWASVNELPFELGELITIVRCSGCSLCLFDGCETVSPFLYVPKPVLLSYQHLSNLPTLTILIAWISPFGLYPWLIVLKLCRKATFVSSVHLFHSCNIYSELSTFLKNTKKQLLFGFGAWQP